MEPQHQVLNINQLIKKLKKKSQNHPNHFSSQLFLAGLTLVTLPFHRSYMAIYDLCTQFDF